MAFMKRRMLFEAEGDENERNAEGNNAQDTTNNAADQGNDAEGDQNNDQGNDNGGQDNAESNDDDADKDNADDEDYSIDSDMDDDSDDSEDDSSNDDLNMDDNNDDSSDDDSSSGEDSEEKQLDRDMFSTLSEDEQKRKIATLKRLYIDLYSKADALIEKFNQVGSLDDEEFGPIIKRILDILYNMKEYVSYYVLNIFDNSSYIENDITFNRYLAVLDGVKLCVEELDKQREEENSKK